MFVCMYEHFWLRFHISICGISAEQINTAHLPQAARAKNNRGRRRRRRICTVYKANGSKWLHLSEFPSYTCVRHYYHIQFNLSSSSIQFERCQQQESANAFVLTPFKGNNNKQANISKHTDEPIFIYQHITLQTFEYNR